MKIITAKTKHINALVPLFDAYRVFYNQPSDIENARRFLLDKIKNNNSVIYIAYMNNEAVGFTQLYHLYSSVSMAPLYVLNDLFVESNHRGKGIGEALINEAKLFSKTNNHKGLAIQTAPDNPAQNLYQRLGFVHDSDLHFFWTNPKS
jgi:GNAT superfamily N-acetyltransferase